jgi:hypothetical protein
LATGHRDRRGARYRGQTDGAPGNVCEPEVAALLRDALNDAPTREFLEIVPLGPIEYSGVLEHMLQDLDERAKRAAASSALSTEDGKTRPGRTRAAPIDASSAKLFCAALIAEA